MLADILESFRLFSSLYSFSSKNSSNVYTTTGGYYSLRGSLELFSNYFTFYFDSFIAFILLFPIKN